MEITWADPPAPKTGIRGNRIAFVEELKKHPGRWALYGQGARSNAAGNWQQKMPGVEAVGRKNDAGTYDLYVRWIGEQP